MTHVSAGQIDAAIEALADGIAEPTAKQDDAHALLLGVARQIESLTAECDKLKLDLMTSDFLLEKAKEQRDSAPSPLAVISDYDAGLLNDFGGGDVGWWLDYMRAEIARANEHWRTHLEAMEGAPAAVVQTANSPLPADVARLVVAARIVAYEDKGPEAIAELDAAAEAFAGLVRWEGEPDHPSENDAAPPQPDQPIREEYETTAAAVSRATELFNAGQPFEIEDRERGTTYGMMAGIEVHSPFWKGRADDFQARVGIWMLACFGADITNSRLERCYRFFEEAGELCQSLDMTEEMAHDMVSYTWRRDKGAPAQEVGGVMVTLAALCFATGLDMAVNGETELARINTPEVMAKIRVKHNAKVLRTPHSALPGPTV